MNKDSTPRVNKERNTKFEPLKGKPRWLYNKTAALAVKVDAEGRTIDHIRRLTTQTIYETIDLHQRACKLRDCSKPEKTND